MVAGLRGSRRETLWEPAASLAVAKVLYLIIHEGNPYPKTVNLQPVSCINLGK